MLPSSSQQKHWVLSFNPTKYGEAARKPEYLNDYKATTVRKFLHDRNAKYIDLTDDDGNLRETIPKKDIADLRSIHDTGMEGSERHWICDHGRKQAMTQGMYTDQFGNRSWRGECSCPKPQAVPSMR